MAHGLQLRLSALAGSFLLLSMALFPGHDLSSGLNLLSAGLFLGHILAVYALAWLGRSPPLGLGIITRRTGAGRYSSQPGPS